MPKLELVAHRGLAARFPENTLAAYAAALEAGATWLETDVQLSSDGVPFLFHDRDLRRLCDLAGPLSERTELELGSIAASFRARFGTRFGRERVARLEQLVELVRTRDDVRVFVELKRATLERFGVDFVLDRVLATIAPLEKRAILISFSLPALVAARKRCGLALGAVFDRWDELEALRSHGLSPEFVFCDLDGLPPQGELGFPGARIAIYEVTDGATARALAARGVALVESFDVERLATELAGEVA
ncbi:MAG: glycerophosphodiester phosphodiesterase [Planctomycetes bacterium]|nr:glycerophosphodiester phosphodiesterase [Planctomycetota bacterium]